MSAGTAYIDGALVAGPTTSTRGGSVSIGYDSGQDATVIANPGATVTDTHTLLGSDPTSAGTLAINGANWSDIIDNADTYNSRGYITVGYDDLNLNLTASVAKPAAIAAAQLTIENDGTLTDNTASIASSADSAGTVTVAAGGVWNIGLAHGGGLSVGDTGQGALLVEAGGTVDMGSVGTFLSNGTTYTSGGIGIGYTGDSGTVVVAGAGAVLSTLNGIAVGRGGAAILDVLNGGSVSVATGIDLGVVTGASGTVVVSDATLVNTSTASSIILGDATDATGTLEAENGASIISTLYLDIGGSASGPIASAHGTMTLSGSSTAQALRTLYLGRFDHIGGCIIRRRPGYQRHLHAWRDCR